MVDQAARDAVCGCGACQDEEKRLALIDYLRVETDLPADILHRKTLSELKALKQEYE